MLRLEEHTKGGDTVKISTQKLDLVMARRCVPREALRPVLSAGTLNRVKNGADVRPVTAGRIAKALGVDVTEIIEEEGPNQ